jgi:hypothetical protein
MIPIQRSHSAQPVTRDLPLRRCAGQSITSHQSHHTAARQFKPHRGLHARCPLSLSPRSVGNKPPARPNRPHPESESTRRPRFKPGHAPASSLARPPSSSSSHTRVARRRRRRASPWPRGRDGNPNGGPRPRQPPPLHEPQRRLPLRAPLRPVPRRGNHHPRSPHALDLLRSFAGNGPDPVDRDFCWLGAAIRPRASPARLDSASIFLCFFFLLSRTARA